MAPARRLIRTLVTFLVAAALPAGAGSAAAIGQFHPTVGPHIRGMQKAVQPPTTAECLAFLGFRCYSPNQIQEAYDMGPAFGHGLIGTGKGLDGSGKTIAIVDAFGSPTIAADLQGFDEDFGLPSPPSLKVITPAGTPPAFDPDPNGEMYGWAVEESLDVEYAHAMAPGASILIVNPPSADDADFLKAEAALVA